MFNTNTNNINTNTTNTTNNTEDYLFNPLVYSPSITELYPYSFPNELSQTFINLTLTYFYFNLTKEEMKSAFNIFPTLHYMEFDTLNPNSFPLLEKPNIMDGQLVNIYQLIYQLLEPHYTKNKKDFYYIIEEFTHILDTFK